MKGRHFICLSSRIYQDPLALGALDLAVSKIRAVRALMKLMA